MVAEREISTWGSVAHLFENNYCEEKRKSWATKNDPMVQTIKKMEKVEHR